MTALKEKYVGYGLVRDGATGKPRVDDPAQLHPVQIGMMTTAEREELGLWTGAFARDAEGIKRMTRTDEGVYRAEEPCRAISEIFDGNRIFRTIRRGDLEVGKKVQIKLEN